MPPTTSASRTSIPRGPVRRARGPVRRRLRGFAWALALVVGLGTAAVLGVTSLSSHRHAPAVGCTVALAGTTYTFEPAQVRNAATIAAVAVRQGLPDHAVTIALATALQESKLINVAYGDRDSLGLFQQRPSQGWGTAAQVSDPTYAATAFYRALLKLPDWRSDDVATAAQAVQRSADGAAYAAHEGEGRALAIALTGEQPAGLTCTGVGAGTGISTAAVRTAVTSALGAEALAPGSNTRLGWAAAAWLVANAQADGVSAVAYQGRRWTSSHGWASDPTAGSSVAFTLAPPN